MCKLKPTPTVALDSSVFERDGGRLERLAVVGAAEYWAVASVEKK